MGWGIGTNNEEKTLESVCIGLNGAAAKLHVKGSVGGKAAIFEGGNVGIGTPAPQRNFEITGNGNVVACQLENTGTGGLVYSIFSTNNGSGMGGGKFVIFDDTAQVCRVAIDNAGKVGIGTTAPERNFEITGNGNVVACQLENTGAGGLVYSIFSTNNGSGLGGGKFVIFDDTAGVCRLAIDNAGKVGIGLNNPNQPLHVNGTGTNGVIALFDGGLGTFNRIAINGGSGGDTQTSFQNNGSTKWSVGNDAGTDSYVIKKGDGAFGTDDYFTIDKDGNVGIGNGVTFGAGAKSVLAIKSTDATPAVVPDEIQIFSYKSTALAEKATLGLRTEEQVDGPKSIVANHTLKIWINGTQYDLLLHKQ